MLQLQNFDSNALFQLNPINQQVRKKIDRYSFCLSDKIGKGFSSTVYKGRNDITNEIVAIKVIQLKSLRDHVTKNLLQTQLECIKKINHPHLLKYIDSYETVNNCYIITEYCDGGDLEKQLRVKGKLTENQLVTFFAQFYPGYQSFLNSGFIHRDLKPANIFLKGDQIRIADFGMVKKTSQNPKDNYNVGTPVYMPPQSMLSNIYTQKSDVWSIGVMCYQLTHGVLPWKGANQQQLKMNIQNNRVHFDYNLISLDLIKFISQCLDKNPTTRIGIAEMMSQPWMQKVIPYMISVTLTPQRFFSGQVSPKFYLKHNNSLTTQTPFHSIQNRISNTSNPIRNTTTPKPTLNSNPSINYLIPVPSLQLGQLNQNINTLNKLNPLKSQRPTMDSEVRPKRKSCYIDFKQKQNHMLASNNYNNHVVSQNKKSLDYLVSILNYLRYLNKVIKLVSDSKNILIKYNTKNMLKTALVKQLMKCLENQEQIAKNKQNIYGLADWDEFVNGKKWSTYAGVIDQYSQKYRKLFDIQMKENISYQQQQRKLSLELKPLIQQLFRTAKNNMLFSQQKSNLFQLLQILDYLITVYNLNQVIENYGWLTFVNKSPINNIVQCKCVVDANNYQDIWEKLQSRTKLICTNL